MGVEPKTVVFNEYLRKFTEAMDNEEYDKVKGLYEKLKEMVDPNSSESKVLKLDMEMVEADDKA